MHLGAIYFQYYFKYVFTTLCACVLLVFVREYIHVPLSAMYTVCNDIKHLQIHNSMYGGSHMEILTLLWLIKL